MFILTLGNKKEFLKQNFEFFLLGIVQKDGSPPSQVEVDRNPNPKGANLEI